MATANSSVLSVNSASRPPSARALDPITSLATSPSPPNVAARRVIPITPPACMQAIETAAFTSGQLRPGNPSLLEFKRAYCAKSSDYCAGTAVLGFGGAECKLAARATERTDVHFGSKAEVTRCIGGTIADSSWTQIRLASGETRMKRQSIGRRGVLAGVGGLLASPAIVRAQGQNGVALVIGNSKYQWEAQLPNVRRDAPDDSSSLASRPSLSRTFRTMR